MCEHVYRNFGPGPCPKCGLPTHDIDWVAQHRKMAEHREEFGYFYNCTTWWSI
jgi:hypothetical protein